VCRQFEITKKIIQNFVNQKNNFTETELYDEITMNGGVLNVGIGITAKEYLEMYERDGLLEYNPKNREYIVKE
jgi:hypothetical protein